ncbi:MAG: META domain-containing protein [Burkholderiales bacterium]|nr:META domain-containing protein [Anaerolineae bacterium]
MLDTLVQSFTFESLAGVPVPLPEPLPDQPTPVVEPTAVADATFGGLAGPTWTLVSFTLPDATLPVVKDSIVTLSFNQEGAGGNAGCNSYSGTFEYSGSTLTFGQIISTLMACVDNNIMQQEINYLAALQGVTRYQIINNRLDLFYILADGTQGVLTFNPA